MTHTAAREKQVAGIAPEQKVKATYRAVALQPEANSISRWAARWPNGSATRSRTVKPISRTRDSARGSATAVISNGVINLAPDKTSVFREAARILKPGARLALADIVTESRLAEGITCDATLWAACRSCSEIREFEHSFWTLVIGR